MDVEIIKTSLVDILEGAFDSNSSIDWQEALDTVEDLIRANSELLCATQTQDSHFCLHTQIEEGNEELVRVILHFCKTQIIRSNEIGYSPLAHAIALKNKAVFELLLQFGAPIHWKGVVDGAKNSSLLHVAAFHGSVEFIPILLTMGLDANYLNSNKQPALSVLARWLDTASSEQYNQCLVAMAYLFAQSHAYTTKRLDELHDALELFRRNTTILYTLVHRGVIKVPKETLDKLVSELKTPISNPNFYSDLFKALWTNPTLFNQFIKTGLDVVYNEFRLEMKPKVSLVDEMKQLITREKPPEVCLLVQAAQPHDLKQLWDFFTPRSPRVAAISLASVILAQKESRKTTSFTFFNKEKYKERRALISLWKEKIENHKDGNLTQTLMQAFKELGISDMPSALYHQLAAVLDQMVIKENKTDYSDSLFIEDFKQRVVAVQVLEQERSLELVSI